VTAVRPHHPIETWFFVREIQPKGEHMKLEPLFLGALLALTSGCAHFRNNAGGVADTDQNVLTGGPVAGIRIKNLPAAVKKVLKAEAPTAEVADISTRTRDGRLIYRIVFSEPARNPMLYIAEDGTIVENLND
jgi:hypothetical protein